MDKEVEALIDKAEDIWLARGSSRAEQRDAKLAVGDLINEKYPFDEKNKPIYPRVGKALGLGTHVKSICRVAKWTKELGLRDLLGDIPISHLEVISKVEDEYKPYWIERVKEQKLGLDELRNLIQSTTYRQEDKSSIYAQPEEPKEETPPHDKQTLNNPKDEPTVTQSEILKAFQMLAQLIEKLPSIADIISPKEKEEENHDVINLPEEKIPLLQEYLNFKAQKVEIAKKMAFFKEGIIEGLDCKKAISDIGDVILHEGGVVTTYPDEKVEEVLQDYPDLLDQIREEKVKDPYWEIRGRAPFQERST